MADIEITCPFCEQTLEATDDMIGQIVDCPACQKSFTLEADADEVSDGSVCPSCDAPMEEGAVLCLQCGYHAGLGKKIQTHFT